MVRCNYYSDLYNRVFDVAHVHLEGRNLVFTYELHGVLYRITAYPSRSTRTVEWGENVKSFDGFLEVLEFFHNLEEGS